LHAPARRGGIRRTSKTKINNLGADEFVSNPPFSKAGMMDLKKIENLELLKKVLNSGTLARKLFQII